MFMFSGCSYYDTIVVPPNTVHNDLYGVPDAFTKQTSNEEVYYIQDGGLTNMRIRPSIFNEHAESSREIKATVTNSTMVGQIFRASQDNINGLYLTLESGEVIEAFDDFESYTSSADLQTTWVASGDLAILETTNVYNGNKSMRLRAQNTGNTWQRSFSSRDWSQVTGSFYAYFTKDYEDMKFRVYVIDSAGNTKSQAIVQNTVNTWDKYYINVADMHDDQTTPTNTSDIVGVGFYVEERNLFDYMYVDDLYATYSNGEIAIELYDMGSTIPINSSTSLNDGVGVLLGDITNTNPVYTIYEKIQTGKRLYHIEDFVHGVAREIPTNTLINMDNYYAIVLKYVDMDVNVYGGTFDIDYYKNGYAFTTTNYTTPINQIGANDDIMFTIFSTQDVYVTESRARTDIEPGKFASYMSSVEDSNMITTNIQLVHGSNPGIYGEVSFTDRPIFLEKGGKFNLDYNDDPDDNVSVVYFGIRYVYEPQPVWG